jgi:predicted dinucleotide-binding enzyme
LLYRRQKSLPKGTAGRIALPVASDDARARQKVMALVEESGFDAVDDGSLHATWRQRPGTPCYGADLPADKLRALFNQLGPRRTEAQHAEHLASHARMEHDMAEKGAS